MSRYVLPPNRAERVYVFRMPLLDGDPYPWCVAGVDGRGVLTDVPYFDDFATFDEAIAAVPRMAARLRAAGAGATL